MPQQLELFSEPDAFASPLPSQLIYRSTHPGTRRQLELDKHRVEYALGRSTRRSVGFSIDQYGLRVTAPKWLSIQQIEGSLQSKKKWILAKLQQQQEENSRRLHAPNKWVHGATLNYLGKTVTLKIIAGIDHIAYNDTAQELTVTVPAWATETHIKKCIQIWLQNQANQLFAERLSLYAEKLGVTYHSLTLSSAGTRWGSCTSDGRIRLNWRLMHFALPLIDYVVAHELSHLKEMNHGPRFWKLVESVFPEFEAARKVLRSQVISAL